MSADKPIKEVLEEFKSKGIVVTPYYGTPTLLTIDIDSTEAYDKFIKNIEILQKYEQAIVVNSWQSKSGGQHFLVSLDKPRTAKERAMLQAFLGSDPTREILGYFNTVDDEPFVLFRPGEHVV